MTKLIKVDTQEYPISIAEFKRRHPNTSFPVQISFVNYGYAVVFDTPKPVTTRIEQAVEGVPNLTGLGTYEKTYTVQDTTTSMSAEDLATLTDTLKEQVKVSVTSKRYEVETGGLTLYDGTEISTDKLAQSMLSGAYSNVTRNPTKMLDWKGANGWVTISKAQLDTITDVVGDHVQAAFSNERAHHEAVDLLGTVQEVVDYDITVGW